MPCHEPSLIHHHRSLCTVQKQHYLSLYQHRCCLSPSTTISSNDNISDYQHPHLHHNGVDDNHTQLSFKTLKLSKLRSTFIIPLDSLNQIYPFHQMASTIPHTNTNKPTNDKQHKKKATSISSNSNASATRTNKSILSPGRNVVSPFIAPIEEEETDNDNNKKTNRSMTPVADNNNSILAPTTAIKTNNYQQQTNKALSNHNLISSQIQQVETKSTQMTGSNLPSHNASKNSRSSIFSWTRKRAIRFMSTVSQSLDQSLQSVQSFLSPPPDSTRTSNSTSHYYHHNHHTNQPTSIYAQPTKDSNQISGYYPQSQSYMVSGPYIPKGDPFWYHKAYYDSQTKQQKNGNYGKSGGIGPMDHFYYVYENGYIKKKWVRHNY